MSILKKQELFEHINKIIANLRPYLQSDGGDIELIDVTPDMVVQVKLTGACVSCPFSIHTLKAGVESSLKKEIPEIKEVIAV